jgi:predicted amidohydrolase YtcJ
VSRRLVVAQRILTGGGEPGATALALEDGRVVGTGRAEDFRTWAGPTTAVTRFPEHVVSPGFV